MHSNGVSSHPSTGSVTSVVGSLGGSPAHDVFAYRWQWYMSACLQRVRFRRRDMQRTTDENFDGSTPAETQPPTPSATPKASP